MTADHDRDHAQGRAPTCDGGDAADGNRGAVGPAWLPGFGQEKRYALAAGAKFALAGKWERRRIA